jgi:ABC-type branched-subunit amino acid transport system substrate-binding protein
MPIFVTNGVTNAASASTLGSVLTDVIATGTWLPMMYPEKEMIKQNVSQQRIDMMNEYRLLGAPMRAVSVLFYSVMVVLGEAIQNAGSADGEDIREALLNNSYETIGGTMNFDNTGLSETPYMLFQWGENGEPETLLDQGTLPIIRKLPPENDISL